MGEVLSCKNHLPDGGAISFACFQSPTGRRFQHPTVWGMVDMLSFFTGILPRKLRCPLKNSGWTTTFLLKWPLFRGHVRFQGCISTGQSDFVRNRSNLPLCGSIHIINDSMTRHESINSYIYQLVQLDPPAKINKHWILKKTTNKQTFGLGLDIGFFSTDFRTMALRLRYRTPCASSGPSHDSAQRKIAIHA